MKNMYELGWRVGEEYAESKQAEYVKRVVEELNAIPRQKIPPTKEQALSTQKLLAAQALRDPKDDEAYWEEKWSAPFPEGVVAEEVPRGDWNLSDVAIAEGLRHGVRNTTGQSQESSVSEESRDKGIQAFTYSKPADLSKEDMDRVVELIGIKSEPIPEADLLPEKPKSTTKSFLDRFISTSWLVGKGKTWKGTE